VVGGSYNDVRLVVEATTKPIEFERYRQAAAASVAAKVGCNRRFPKLAER
jgi:hypothetical protein